MTKYSMEVRQEAVELIEKGCGKYLLASSLAIPHNVAEKWICTYKSVGRKIFLDMGSKHRKYDFETKLAAVHDRINLGMTRQEVMAKYLITSISQITAWERAYREGGAEALRPKPKGRPRKVDGAPPKPMTYEQKLEVENERLRTEVAYLKKLRALEAQKQTRGKNVK